jgi:hypothetical protein
MKTKVNLTIHPTLTAIFAAFSLAACHQSDLPPGAYGRVAASDFACKDVEGLQRANDLFASGQIDVMKNLMTTIWSSGSCISFAKGDVIYIDGEFVQGFVKVGINKSDISYFANPSILEQNR